MSFAFPVKSRLTHWGRVTHICVCNLTIIGQDNGLSPGRQQAIIWTNAGILLIGPWGTNFCEILIGIQAFSFKKMHLKLSSAKWRPFCLGLNVLMHGWLGVQVLSDSKHYLNEVLPISVGSVRAQLLSLLVPFGEIWKILPELLPRRGSLTIWVVVVMWYSETAEPCSHLGEKYR